MTPFRYKSGDLVNVGDRIVYCGRRGQIVRVFTEVPDVADDEELRWLKSEFERGVTIEGEGFGRIVLRETIDQEDLELEES